MSESMVESLFSRMRRFVADPDVAIDLGTANTRVYALGLGLVADEPSVVPTQISSQTASAPQDMPQRRPLRAGVIADVPATVCLLRDLLRRGRRFGLTSPRALVCAPTDASDEERAALVEATRLAGASAVLVRPEPLAAAIGAGLDVASPYAQLLVDIGDGVTDIALVASGQIVSSWAVRTACADIHAEVAAMLATRHDLLVSYPEAERLARQAGVAPDGLCPEILQARGLDCLTGHPTTVAVNGAQVLGAIEPTVRLIVGAVLMALRDLSGKASCEVIEGGISLTGGGALLRGMDRLIAAETHLAVHRVADPMHAVIDGAREMLRVGSSTGLWR
jgi:rod shape-determining protein MreB